MTTNVDITNRALQLIGTRTTIAALNESSNEAIQANLAYSAILDWCLGVVNWNFARKTAALAIAKSNTNPLPEIWDPSQISPAWVYEYSIPTDFIKAQYLTDSSRNTGVLSYIGEPQRFVVAYDSIAAADKRVILTNQLNAVLVYTARITDPTVWPWTFERFMVAALAWTLAPALTTDKEVIPALNKIMFDFLTAGVQANLEEGLSFGDTTPEWIQALGINYPFRRQDGKDHNQPQVAPNDNRSR
jgi:hypothetical protein